MSGFPPRCDYGCRHLLAPPRAFPLVTAAAHSPLWQSAGTVSHANAAGTQLRPRLLLGPLRQRLQVSCGRPLVSEQRVQQP